MRKFTTLFAACLLCAATAFAIPAKRIPTTITQSDGTKVTITMMGDEWSHSYVTSDFKTVGIGSDGDVYYRTANGLSDVRAHEFVQRNASELDFLSKSQGIMGIGAIQKTSRRTQAAQLMGAPAKVGSTQVPTIGTPRVPVIVVEFSDKHCSNPIATFQDTYTTGPNSVYQYFYDQSNSLYRPQYDVYGIYNLNKTRATYGGNDSYGDDVGVAQMVYDAVIASNNDIDWTNYDNDGDGEADVVIVVYAGVGEAQAYQVVPNAVWPCQWTLSSASYYGDGPGAVYLDGIKVNRFGVFNEINGSNDNGTNIDGIGTFCHEFSHCLGLPDFYETTYNYGYYGIGSWSLMDYGSYNNNGYTPIGYNAYEKNFMGWLDLQTPVPGHKYTLPIFNQKNVETDIAYKVTSPINSNEYYVLENRAKQGWDSYIDDEGMMIIHVSYIPERWSNNSVNNQSVQLFTIVPADNSLSNYSETTDLWGETKHELTDTSTPAARLNLTSSGSATGSAGYMGQPLTEIDLSPDGTVSFWYIKDAVVVFDPVLNDASNINDISFTASWSDETDEEYVTCYDLQITRQSAAGDAPSLKAWESGDDNSRLIRAIHTKSYNVTGLTAGATYAFKIRANHVNDITGVWSEPKVVTLANQQVIQPSITSESSIDFGEVESYSSSTKTLNFSAIGLRGDVTATLNDPDNVFSLSTTTIPREKAENGAKVDIVFTPATYRTYSATVTLSSQNAESVTLTLSGTGLPLKATPQFVGDAYDITTNSFTAQWNPVEYIDSYTIDVTRVSGMPVKYVLVKDINDLGDGDRILVVCSSKGKAAGALADTYLTAENVSISYNEIEEISDAVSVFTLNASGNNWTLANSEGQYLTSTVARTMSFSDTGSEVAITIDNGKASIDFGENIGRLLYLSSSQKFLTYRGDVTTSVLLPQIFKAIPVMSNVAVSGNDPHFTISGITDTNFKVEGLIPGETYQYKVKARYLDQTEGKWSAIRSVTTEKESGIDNIASDGKISVANGTVTVPDGVNARVYTISGVEVAANGRNRWSLRPGVYVIATGTTARKIIVK